VRVNGGLPAGLDVRVDPGISVVVGSRGVGKTTLLELIRHGLGIPITHSDDSKPRTSAIENCSQQAR
jgi:predicted ATP-binding protein involved in virulence